MKKVNLQMNDVWSYIYDKYDELWQLISKESSKIEPSIIANRP